MVQRSAARPCPATSNEWFWSESNTPPSHQWCLFPPELYWMGSFPPRPHLKTLETVYCAILQRFATWRQLHSDIVDAQDRGCNLADISYAVDMQEWWKVWYRLWRTTCHCPGDQSGCSTAPLWMNKAFRKWWRKCPTTLPPTWGDINLDEGSPWCIPCNSRSYFRTECGPRISWPSPCAITCVVVVTGRCMVSL